VGLDTGSDSTGVRENRHDGNCEEIRSEGEGRRLEDEEAERVGKEEVRILTLAGN